MSHISATNSNGRILHPDIPPPSTNAEHRPPPRSAPLTLTPPEYNANGGTSPRGFWFFKRPHHNRVRSSSSTSSKPGAPQMERSLSEPNSPTEPTSAAGSANQEKAGAKPNYIAMALELLNESKVRFDGHEKDWMKFHDRYQKLFAMGQPINGKIVKYNTPKPNAQDVAKWLVRDIQTKLEELDMEMEILESEDSSSSTKVSSSKRRLKDARRARSSTPEPALGPPLKPWFDPSTVNPVVLDKLNKRQSINPKGTWHGHSRTRNEAAPLSLPNFTAHESGTRDGNKVDAQAIAIHPRNGHGDPLNEERDQNRIKSKEVDKGKDRGRERERERERDRDKERDKEREKEREKSKSKGGEWDGSKDKHLDEDGDTTKERDTWPHRDGERGRKDRHRRHRDNLPLPEYPSRPTSAPRERQMSDPAIYTRGVYRRGNSPESLAPAIYTLAEDVEVRSGASSVVGRNPTATAVPRIPTVVAYPGSEDEELTAAYGRRSEPSAGNGQPSETAIATRAVDAAAAASSAVSSTVVNPGGNGHRRRRRSRSLGHELDERADRSRPRSRSPKKDKIWDREREKPREREERERDRETERERDRDREKGDDRDREKDRERNRQRDRERERDKGKDRDKDRERDKGRNRDRDRDREREKEKYGSTKSKHPEGEWERYDPGGRYHRDSERERDRDKDRDREREREREKDRPREKDKNKERDRDRDRDRNKDHNRSERERLASISTATSSTMIYPNMPGTYGPTPPGFIPASGPAAPPPALVPPPHVMLKFGVPTTGPCPPNPNSESRFMEILTSPAPPMPHNLPGPT